MFHPLGRIRKIVTLIVPLTLLIACNSSSESLALPKASALVQSYVTATVTLDSSSKQIAPEATSTLSITMTPVSYAIVAGDTLLVIAERNGISLDELLLANPGIDARFLSIGQGIFIPLAAGASESSVSVDLGVELKKGETSCFANVAGELWCFFLVENNQTEALENASAQIQLLSSTGEVLAQKEAYGQIRKLDSGAKMPLIAYWKQAPQAWHAAIGQLTGAFIIDDPSERYLALELIDLNYSVSDSAKSASVSATISGTEISSATSIRVLAVAYAEDGRVIGTRLETIILGETAFSFELFSLGPMIADVEVWLEGRR